MANLEPVPGRCNAKRKRVYNPATEQFEPQTYCANKPHNPHSETNKRCKFHGGLNTAPKNFENIGRNNVKHGLYAKQLRKYLLNDEERALWDAMEVNTDLTNELLLARARVARFQRMLSEGTTTVDGDAGRVWEVEDLLERAMTQVERLAARQHDMHPEQNAQGNMSISISIDTGGADVQDEDVPDLDADGKMDEAVPTAHREAEPQAEPEPGPLDEFNDD